MGTLTKTVKAEFASDSASSAFTATQAKALTEGLVAQFVEETIAVRARACVCVQGFRHRQQSALSLTGTVSFSFA